MYKLCQKRIFNNLRPVGRVLLYSLSLAALASRALVATWARSDSSADPCDCALFNRKWLMKSFNPSRSIPSLGIPEILKEEDEEDLKR